MQQVNLQPGPRQWIESSVLQPYVGSYLEHLYQRRYSATSQRQYLCCVAHFAHWVTLEGLRLAGIDERTRTRFISEHLPICDCPYPVRRSPWEIRAAVSQLLEVLRKQGAIRLAQATDARGVELAAFDAHMLDVGGLAVSTRRQRSRFIARFLEEQFGSRAIDIAEINPAAARRFVLGEQNKWSAGTINVVGGTMAAYLRFRATTGDKVTHLLNAIPRAAHWRLAALPDVLSDAEIDALLASFDQDFPSRRRAFAMVRCLIDLGLRCEEVAKLQLDDVDWQRGTLRVAATKVGRADILPLPAATGGAIADYLQHERPATRNRAIFPRHVAPFDRPIKRGVVKDAVVAAYRRCGWERTHIHVLRHSVASRLLRAGIPMKQIADILRHRSLDTSIIYTKIDLNRLAAVAMPWPGSAA